MLRLISLLLALALTLSSLVLLSSCKPDPEKPENPVENPEPNPDEDSTLIVPDFKDYERRTVNFSDIVYKRPDADALIAAFEAAAEAVKNNTLPFEEQVEAIESLEPDYEDYLTMYSYSNILMSKDTTNTYWSEEYGYISGKAHSLSRAVEKLYVAAAQSENAEKFEEEYFGDGLIEEYADGGYYTDELVALFEEETELENRFSTLSTSNVKITYKSHTGTFDEIMGFYSEMYGEKSLTYQAAYEECLAIYQAEVNKHSRSILVKLFKIRRQIADELGAESYSSYAYDTIYHDYTEEEMLDYISDIAQYVLPIYLQLNYRVLAPHFYAYDSTEAAEVTECTLLNGLYTAYGNMDTDILDIYSYMLQHKLYDVAPYEENRFSGSFCTYINSYDAPFVFVSANGNTEDYSTVAHEFGHFVDSYVNFDSYTSLDLSEVSSQGLEFLTLLELEDDISDAEYKHLCYSMIDSVCTTLIYQGFYALFEHYAYMIEYDDISEEALVTAMKAAAEDMGLNPDYFTSLDYILIPHIVLYPFYVQSYCTSVAVALEMYYIEKEEDGEGIGAYRELILREDSDMTFEEHVESAGLSSPFEDDYLKELADKIHYDILGSHYYTQSKNDSAA